MPNASLTIDGTEIISKENGVVSLKNTNADTSLSFPANHAGIKTALNASGDAPVYACRAWVTFDGTQPFSPNPGTSAIFNHGNVSSMEDLGTGKFAINFDVNMPHANYAVTYSIEDGAGFDDIRVLGTDNAQVRTSSRYEFYTWDGANLNDPEVMSLAFFA